MKGLKDGRGDKLLLIFAAFCVVVCAILAVWGRVSARNADGEIRDMETRLENLESEFAEFVYAEVEPAPPPPVRVIEITDEETDMLERVIAAEARGSSFEGQLAVAEVVINRSRLWGMSVTEVLTAPHQFAKPYGGGISAETKRAAAAALSGERMFDEDATHFHATYVYPSWAKSKKELGRIEGHVFYGEKR